jgi:hypothetical protein
MDSQNIAAHDLVVTFYKPSRSNDCYNYGTPALMSEKALHFALSPYLWVWYDSQK